MAGNISFTAVFGFDGAQGPYFWFSNTALSTYSWLDVIWYQWKYSTAAKAAESSVLSFFSNSPYLLRPERNGYAKRPDDDCFYYYNK